MARSNTDKAQRHADGAVKMFKDAHARLDAANRLLDQEVAEAEGLIDFYQQAIIDTEQVRDTAAKLKVANQATQQKLAGFLQ